jgi:anti-repressor protein
MEQKFNYENLPVRTMTDEQEQTWFAGIDICKILNYSNPNQAIDKLDDDEKKLASILDMSGQYRQTWTINESGLYTLILTSNKPEAKKFRRWVTHDVLPTIRKAGIYSTEQTQQREFELQEVTKQLTVKRDELATLKNDLKLLSAKVKELEKSREEIITNYHPKLPFPEFKQKIDE